MLSVNLVVVGSLKEKFYKDAESEFLKRLSAFCKFNVFECSESSFLTGDAKLEKEAEEIKAKLKGTVFVCDILGELVSSEDLAKKIENSTIFASTITFVIGGSNGLATSIKALAKEKISMGRITLPHNMARIVLEEQIYRAFTIISGKAYHK